MRGRWSGQQWQGEDAGGSFVRKRNVGPVAVQPLAYISGNVAFHMIGRACLKRMFSIP